MARKDRINVARPSKAITAGPDTVHEPAKLQNALERHIVRSPAFVSIYANDIQLMTSPWDMRLVLSEMGDLMENDAVAINQLAELRISLPLAKKLTMMMIEQINKYEARVGVRVPLGVE